MKHECFSSLSFYVELTSLQQRMMPKDITHTTKKKKKKKHFCGIYFRKRSRHVNFRLNMQLLKNQTAEPVSGVKILTCKHLKTRFCLADQKHTLVLHIQRQVHSRVRAHSMTRLRWVTERLQRRGRWRVIRKDGRKLQSRVQRLRAHIFHSLLFSFDRNSAHLWPVWDFSATAVGCSRAVICDWLLSIKRTPRCLGIILCLISI